MSSDISLAQHFTDVTPFTEVSIDTSPTNTHTPVLHSTQATPSSSSLSKYLALPQLSTPSGRRREPPHARLLTSAAALELLNEKQQKKQEEAELKERKRKEREEMKKKREEEQR